MIRKCLTLSAVAIAALAPSLVAAGPAMSTSVVSIGPDQTACIYRAQEAIQKSGFTTAFEVVGANVFGERGPYTASIRCIAASGLAHIVVAGNGKDAGMHIAAIKQQFGSV